MPRTTFEARYPGRCLSCGDEISVGDILRYDDDDRAVHANCCGEHVDLLAARRRKATICPECHLEQPCDCDGGAA